MAQPLLLPDRERSSVEVMGDKVHVRFPDGSSYLRPIESLPEDKIEWIDHEFVKEAREQFEKPTG